MTEEMAEWLGPILSDWLEAHGCELEQRLRATAEQIGATDTSAPLRIAPAAKAARKEEE